MNLMAMKEVMGASAEKKSQTSRSKQNVKKICEKKGRLSSKNYFF